jgi:transcriptional regulator with XRE-family HTH domain
MSYGHADRIAAILAGTSAAGGEPPPIDPRLYDRPEIRRILAERDIAGLYRALNDAGVPQRRIAELTGQSPSEVSEILKGRRVLSYDLLVRIADRLGIPRRRMGLSYGESDAYGGDVTATNPPEGVSAEVLRRHVIALGAIAAVGAPTAGELLTELGNPSPVPLPARISGVHVAQVRDLTRRLSDAATTSGADPEVSSAAAAWATRRLDVPGTESAKRALKTAVSELHIHAGWAAFDSGLYDRTMFHYARGLEIATEAGDPYCETTALNFAGLATVEHGQPNDGLKILQWAGFKSRKIPPDKPRAVVLGERSRTTLQACGQADSATALADLDCWEAADTALANAREQWSPTSADPYGDLDRPAACLELKRGRLDSAEPFAAASVRRWESGGQVSRTQSAIVLATIHVRAGEPDGLRLAHGAITGASKLHSIRARQRLEPLAVALEGRRGSDPQQLARMARQVATTRV